MIELDKLTAEDRGRWVKYHDQKDEFGRIKSWNNGYIFVVFHSDERWADFMHFTGEACHPEDLEFWMACTKCNAPMQNGMALLSTFVSAEDDLGGDTATINYGGGGEIVRCLKCPTCGFSVALPS